MIASFEARLRERCSGLKEIRTAEDLDLLEKATAVQSGTAFVIPYRERAGENHLSAGGFRQLVVVQVIVAFVIRRHDDVHGAERARLFDTLKAEIEGALAGWTPDGGHDACELVGGEGTPLGNGTSIYVQTWETSRLLEGA